MNRILRLVFLLTVFVTLEMTVFPRGPAGAESSPENSTWLTSLSPVHRKINFVFVGNRRNPNPQGWIEYDGSIYNSKRGYGWLDDISANGRDREANAVIVLPDKTKTSAQELGRLELTNWQGTHRENRPLVFRIDLPDGWYRVCCSSVDAGSRPLPLVDQRSFKCRANDAVFAGPKYGPPLVVSGDELVEGSEIVEVTEGHLRIVVGDPAYGGWTWKYQGPWFQGWARWWGFDYRYANGWDQRLTRKVDPGFHSLRLNSLEIEQVSGPAKQASLVFRDSFNRDDNPDVNMGVAKSKTWLKVKLHPKISDDIRAELYKTSIRLTSHQGSAGVIGLLQQKLSPGHGTIRYSTRVSLFTGEGSQKHSGTQEAGILMLADPSEPADFHSTFVGVAFDSSRSDTMGRLIYRVGDGKRGYRFNQEVPDTNLPFRIVAGEFNLTVEHDVVKNVLSRIEVNGVDVTNQWSLKSRMQRKSRGLFGLRSRMNDDSSRTRLQQFYWHYLVERL